MTRFARPLWFASLAGLFLGLLSLPIPGAAPPRAPDAPALALGRPVYLGHGLSDEGLLTLGVAANAHDAVLLLHSPDLSGHLRTFLAAYRPERVLPVGDFPEGRADLERRLGPVQAPVAARSNAELCRALFASAERVVVCPAEPRGRLLLAACLAAEEGAPLWIAHGRPGEVGELRAQLRRWGTTRAFLVGEAGGLGKQLAGVKVVRIHSPLALAQAHQRRLQACKPIETAVVCNPHDSGPAAMAVLAPWLAGRKRAALLLTGKDGRDAGAVVERAVRRPGLRRVEALLFAADLKAVPMERRPNPIPKDRDPFIEMEPLTPLAGRPFSFAVGRLFHKDRAAIPLLLARQELLARSSGARKALVASNPGGGLPLLETFSRSTVQELRNAGYRTTALFGHAVTGPRLRKLLPEHDLFLWEGHHNTLVKDWGFAKWDEPLPPSLMFLQSCLALTDWKVQPLLSRGAVGAIGSSTRTYSGSGGACSLAFFNALLYDGLPVGASLRQAKNFLLVYALLKEKRLGTDATRTGANVRAAWAFTLWGDPTLELPAPPRPAGALPAVAHRVEGNVLVLEVPERRHERTKNEKYQVRMPPNGRLAGLVRKDGGADGKPLVPFVFAEVSLPRARPGQVPALRTRLPASHWAFLWDERRRCGYVLVTPRARDGRELRFHIDWAPAAIAQGANR